jgi:hypothetical protein
MPAKHTMMTPQNTTAVRTHGCLDEAALMRGLVAVPHLQFVPTLYSGTLVITYHHPHCNKIAAEMRQSGLKSS